MEDLPVELDKLLSFDFSNLITVINFLYQNSITLNQKINDTNKKIKSFSEFKTNIDNLEIKYINQNRKIEEAEKTLSNFQINFLNFDSQIKDLQEKGIKKEAEIENLFKDKEILSEKINSHEQNLNNLNRVVEENVKDFEKEKEKIENHGNSIIKLIDDTDSNTNDIMELNNRIDANNKKFNNIIEGNKEKNNEIHKQIVSQIEKIDKKIVAINNKLVQDDKEKAKQNEVEEKEKIEVEELDKEENIINENENNLPNISSQQISLINEDLELIKKQLSDLNVSEENLKKLYNHQITEINVKINDLSKNIVNLYNEEKEKNTLDKLIINEKIEPQAQIKEKIISEPTPVVNQIVPIEEVSANSNNKEIVNIQKTVNKLQENIKILISVIDQKLSKEDIDKISNSMMNDLTKTNDKFIKKIQECESSINELKLSGFSDKNSGGQIDMEVIKSTINNEIDKKIETDSEKIIKNILENIDISSNKNISGLQNDIKIHTDELNKAFESIIEIRNNLLSKDVEEQVIQLLTRMSDSEANFRKIKFSLDEVNKLIEGDNNEKDEGDNTNIFAQGSIKHYIILLSNKIVAINQNIDKLEKKLENINKDILIIVKKDLKNESNRILDEFKFDLKQSIAKIDEQLKNKVDRFNLLEFGQKINSKFSHEMKFKIDRGDLSKNTNVINRKIDSLENKISKTLVDTLIDLQMDENPLIIKKNMKLVDRCASCNQVLPPNNSGYYVNPNNVEFSRYKNNLTSSYGNTAMNTSGNSSIRLTKLPDIIP